MKYEELLKNYEDAKKYLAQIGADQPHFRDGSKGKLSYLEIETEIDHKRYSGSTNYHKNKHFDEYLVKIVKEKFTELSELALERMYKDMLESLVAEHDSLMEKLTKIQEAKKKLYLDA